MTADILYPLNHSTAGEPAFNLGQTSNTLIYHVGAYDTCSVQMVTQGTTGIVTLYRSNDGSTPVALEIADTVGPGNDMSNTVDCSAFMYLHVRVTTTESVYAKFIVIGKRE
jgi:hypothetical protein